MSGRETLLVTLLVVASTGLWGATPAAGTSVPGGVATGSEEGPRTDSVFTIETGSIDVGPDGRICAERIGPNTNRVVLENVRLSDVTMYLSADYGTQQVDIPSATVDRMVIYSNGENLEVTALALAGLCVSLDQQDVVLESYRVEARTLSAKRLQFVAGDTDERVPEPGGLRLGSLLPVAGGTNGTGGLDEPGSVTDPLGEVSGLGGDPTDAVTGVVTGPANGTVGDATPGADGVLEGVTETPGDTVDRVANETDRVVDRVTNGTAQSPVRETNGTGQTGKRATNGSNGPVDGAVNRTDGSVDRGGDGTDQPDEEGTDGSSTVGQVVNETDATVEETTDAVGDATEGALGTVTGTVANATDATDGIANTSDDGLLG